MDDKLKEQLMPSLMVFNFCLAAYMAVRSLVSDAHVESPDGIGPSFHAPGRRRGHWPRRSCITFVVMMRKR